MTWTPVCDLADLSEEPKGVRAGTTGLVACLVEGEPAIFDALCPHKFAPLEEGHIEDGCLVCPVHEAHFSLANGMPRQDDGWAGQLRKHPSRIVDGTVEADL